jgi:preprotein translocase subunit SecG
MSTILTILHVLVCLFLMLTVLLQAGKGGGMGAAFGGGSSSGSVFGGSGAGNFLKKLTVGAAIVFVFTSMSLAYLASTTGSDSLKSYSAQQRRNAELTKQRHDQATSGTAAPAAGAATTDEAAATDEAVDTGDAVDPGATAPDTMTDPATAAEGADGKPSEAVPSTGEGAALEKKPPVLEDAKKKPAEPAAAPAADKATPANDPAAPAPVQPTPSTP